MYDKNNFDILKELCNGLGKKEKFLLGVGFVGVNGIVGLCIGLAKLYLNSNDNDEEDNDEEDNDEEGNDNCVE